MLHTGEMRWLDPRTHRARNNTQNCSSFLMDHAVQAIEALGCPTGLVKAGLLLMPPSSCLSG